jgi:hypothetical protein
VSLTATPYLAALHSLLAARTKISHVSCAVFELQVT